MSGQALQAVDPLGLDKEIRVNAAPEGVKPGERFIIDHSGQGGVVSAEKFQKAAKGRQVYIYDPKGGLDPDVANAMVMLKQALESGDKSSIVQDFLVGAALISGESADAIRTDGTGEAGGLPGGNCRTNCVSGAELGAVYVVVAIAGVLGGGNAKGKAKQALTEAGEALADAAQALRNIVATARKGAKRGPKPGGPTDQLNKEIADELEDAGMTVTHGGGRGVEEYFPGPGGSRKGSNRADITAVEADPSLPKQRVQTVDTYASGLPNKREWGNAGAIIKRNRRDGMTLIPKKQK